MTKSEKKEVARLDAVARMGTIDLSNIGYAARGFSGLIRAAGSQKARNELIVASMGVPAVGQHPDFVI